MDEGPVPEHTAKQKELGSDRWATSLDTGLLLFPSDLVLCS